MSVGPFERHIREAIELNRQRAPVYAAASAGVSLGLSRSLIRRERLLLPLARWFDRRAAVYARAGIPIMEELFVSMATAPTCVARLPAPPPRLPPPSTRDLVRELRRAYSIERFAGVAPILERELEGLSVDPGYWCMLRHMLESARRISLTASDHAGRARRAGLPSPGWIHGMLFRLHLAGLADASRLDARALPLQRQGIPILCRDLPPIAPRP